MKQERKSIVIWTISLIWYPHVGILAKGVWIIEVALFSSDVLVNQN